VHKRKIEDQLLPCLVEHHYFDDRLQLSGKSSDGIGINVQALHYRG